MKKFIIKFAALGLMGSAFYIAGNQNAVASMDLSDGAARSFCFGFDQKCRVCEATKKNFATIDEFYLARTTRMDERLKEYILSKDRLDNFDLDTDKLIKTAKRVAKNFHDVKEYFPKSEVTSQVDIDKVNKAHRDSIAFLDSCYGKKASAELLQKAVIEINTECRDIKTKYGSVKGYDEKKGVKQNVIDFLETHEAIAQLRKENSMANLVLLFEAEASKIWADVAYHLGFQTTTARVCFGKKPAKEAMYNIVVEAFLNVLEGKLQTLALEQPQPPVDEPPVAPPAPPIKRTPSRAPPKPLPQVSSVLTLEQQLNEAARKSWERRRAEDPLVAIP